MLPSVSLPRGGLLPLSRGRFPMSGGNGRRPKEVGMMSRSDRGDRDRRPNAHTGADEVRPSKPPVPSTDHRNRAAQCAAPTGWSGFPATGDRKGRPYGFTRACLNPRAGRSQTVLPITDRLSPARPGQARKWNRNSCNFCLTQAPVGRWEFRPTTQISTRRKFYTSQQVRVPP